MNAAGPDVVLLERLLTDAFGTRVTVRRIERLEPWCVSRAHLIGPATPTVVVKWLRDGATRGDPQQLRTERAALELLTALGLEIAPTLLATDDDAGLHVLEDLAPRVSLSDLIRAGDELATTGLAAFARTMGQLHAATAGHAPGAPSRRLNGGSWSWTLPRFDRFGISATSGARAEMVRVRDTLLTAGALTAFSNGDAGTNNFLVKGTDGRIIDWEFAVHRHALVDAVCLHVPGPQWMTVSDPRATGAADAYRRALVEGVPSAADDEVFAPALAAACLAVAMERLDRLPTLDARPPGHESRAQMISTLESAARTANGLCAFPHLAGWADTAAAGLRRRWPDADRRFPDAYTIRA